MGSHSAIMNGNIPILINAPNDISKYITGITGASRKNDPEIEKVIIAEIISEAVLISLNSIKINAGPFTILFIPIIR